MKTSLQLACLTALLATLSVQSAPLVPSPAAAHSELDLENRITQLISDPQARMSPEDWKSLGPHAAATLLSLYQRDTNTFHRIRLLEALAWVEPDLEATAFMKEQAQLAKNDLLRSAALESLAISRGDEEEAFLSGFLRDEDPQIRFSAAHALGHLPGAMARSRLEHYLKEEKLPWIGEKLAREHEQATPRPVLPSPLSETFTETVAESWAGIWKGMELLASPKNFKSVVPSPVELVINAAGKGCLRTRFLGKSKRFLLRLPELGRQKISGELLETGKDCTAPLLPERKTPFEVRLLKTARGLSLSLDLPTVPAIALLTR
jgi:hypothetical protein